jgi:hypothetical protein
MYSSKKTLPIGNPLTDRLKENKSNAAKRTQRLQVTSPEECRVDKEHTMHIPTSILETRVNEAQAAYDLQAGHVKELSLDGDCPVAVFEFQFGLMHERNEKLAKAKHNLTKVREYAARAGLR